MTKIPNLGQHPERLKKLRIWTGIFATSGNRIIACDGITTVGVTSAAGTNNTNVR